MSGDPDDRLFVVTTRSRLHGARHFPAMLMATRRIRRQLAGADSVVGWASVVAGPTEFWTVSVWRSRHDMQEFMRSGAHEQIMWLMSRWVSSFWLMRWRPGPAEVGTWKGLSLGRPEPAYEQPSDEPPAGSEALQLALEHLPELRSAMGRDGVASYESTSFARRRRAEVGEAGGAVVSIRTSALGTPRALRALRSLGKEAEQAAGCLRVAVGVGSPGEVYLLGVWRDRPAVAAFLASPPLQHVSERWPNGCWANEWIPENEFGHWDGLRLRRTRRRPGISVPSTFRDTP